MNLYAKITGEDRSYEVWEEGNTMMKLFLLFVFTFTILGWSDLVFSQDFGPIFIDFEEFKNPNCLPCKEAIISNPFFKSIDKKMTDSHAKSICTSKYGIRVLAKDYHNGINFLYEFYRDENNCKMIINNQIVKLKYSCEIVEKNIESAIDYSSLNVNPLVDLQSSICFDIYKNGCYYGMVNREFIQIEKILHFMSIMILTSKHD